MHSSRQKKLIMIFALFKAALKRHGTEIRLKKEEDAEPRGCAEIRGKCYGYI